MLIKQCSADSDTRNVAKLFFISLKAQLFVFLLDLDFYTYIFVVVYRFICRCSSLVQILVCISCVYLIKFVCFLRKISQRILPNLFHICESLIVCISPPAGRLLFVFLCTFLRNASQLFAFFPSTFFQKSFHNTEMGLMGFLG